jgi:molybdate transport repressor ModE-like protein
MREVQMENVHPLRLRLLLEIERTRSISAAAQACGIGQPSASMHLRNLEATIGQRLVSRYGRGSSLTAAGKVVALHAARVLATLDSMRRAVDALEARGGGELTLAASLTPSVVLIPGILRQLSDRRPGMIIRVRTVSSQTAAREVARGSVDMGIAGEIPIAEPVTRRQIAVDELVGIAPPGLLNPDEGRISLGELARNRLLLGPDGSSTRTVAERYLARADYRATRVWEFNSYETIKQAVKDRLGVSFISRFLVGQEIERRELVAFRVTGVEPMVRPIHVLQHSAKELTSEGSAFMALLAESPLAATADWVPAHSRSLSSLAELALGVDS